MATRGGSAPGFYRQRQASTLFLRVPSVDWARVKIGEKTEFRTMPRESSRLLTCYTPTPVVAYATANGPLREIVAKLMILEERRYEPLFEVSQDDESLAREGFETYDLFRRYWRKRQHGVYRPSQKVWAWRVREFGREDIATAGERLLHHLYGEWL